MIGVFVTFEPAELDAVAVRRIAEGARGLFEGMPDLRFKFFTLDEQRGTATNFYVWESEDSARVFFDDDLVARVTELYGVAPRIDYVELAEVVDNS